MIARRIVLAAALLAWCRSALALNPSLDVSQYAHASWKVSDGFTRGMILAIAQTPDGYLWLGTETGLLRFDGVKSTAWHPPSNQHLPSDYVQSLLATPDGTLWIGLNRGLASWDGRSLTVYDRFAGRYIGKMLRDRDGALWVTNGRGPTWMLCRMQRTSIGCFGEDGGPGVGAIGLHEGRDGTLWVGTPDGVWRWKPGEPRLYPMGRKQSGLHDGLYDADDGSLRVVTATGISSVADGEVTEAFPFSATIGASNPRRALRDRDGGVWVSTSSGVVHVHEGVVDVLTKADGLSGDLVHQLFEDREGNVWVITRGGLDRFSEAVGAVVSGRQGLANDLVDSVLASRDDSIWAATTAGLQRLRPGSPIRYPARGVTSIFEDRAGRIWAGADRGVGFIETGRFVDVASLPGGLTRAIVEDSRYVWVINQAGIFRVSPDAHLVESVEWHQPVVTAAAADPGKSGVWLGFDTKGIAYYVDGRIREGHSPADGLGHGTVRWLSLEADGTLWIATEGGLSRLRNGRVVTWDRQNGLPCDIILWVVDDGLGSLWLSTNCGIARIKKAELGDSIGAVHPTMFDSTDGVRAYLSQNRFRYKLEGYDSDWQDAGNRRQAFYGHLPPGNYRFRVIASNNSGVWNETGASIDISIPPAYYQTTWFAALVGSLVLALVWGTHRVRFRIVERHEREISALNERLMKAQEQERIRIAGELHDGVMQQMLALTMMLGTAKRKIASNPTEAEASIEKIQQKVIQAGTDIRQLSHGLHPPLLQDEGLPGALRSYCEQFGTASGIAIDCTLDESARDLSRGAALALFRITQEALGNAAKHAKAKHISIRLARTNGTIALTVSDDGVGFDRSRLGTSGGLGLVIMRERAGQLNGTFEFDSAHGRGTTIRVVVPFR